MSKLASAFGTKFVENKDSIRIKSFELHNNTFKVKIPLTSEFEEMSNRMIEVDQEEVEKYFRDLSDGFQKNRESITEDLGVEFLENDVVVQGRSLREAAKNKFLTEKRITEVFKLLVPEQEGFDMDSITYAMIEELFPFSVQMEMVEQITKIISPDYKDTRGK
jgi:hypothetical protein